MSQQKYQYSIIISPENATNKAIEWEIIDVDNNPGELSSITGKALIDTSGWVTPVSVGFIKVVAKSTDGSNKTAELVVEITNRPILIDSVEFSTEEGHNPTLIYLDVTEE